jgi:leukotriene-A4 hydrolase
MLASLNYQELLSEIETMTAAGSGDDTKLKLDLQGRNPDEGVTSIAYNKGYFFLRSIEEQVGRDKFDAFVRHYFSTNAFRSMDTERFIPFLKSYYSNTWSVILDDAFINAWIFTPGLPASCPAPRAIRFGEVDAAIATWKNSATINEVTRKVWGTHEWLHFLKNLPEKLTKEQMESLDTLGDFTHSGNAEVIAVWSVLAIHNQYERMYSTIERFLINTGRRKFLMPVYAAFVKTAEGKDRALSIYKNARSNYHFVARNSIDKLLDITA